MADVQQALAGIDTFDLKASFRQAFAYSVPPLTLYRNYQPGANSDLSFGVLLADASADQYNVPIVVRTCIEEVEKRGMDTEKIYSVRSSRLMLPSVGVHV